MQALTPGILFNFRLYTVVWVRQEKRQTKNKTKQKSLSYVPGILEHLLKSCINDGEINKPFE